MIVRFLAVVFLVGASAAGFVGCAGDDCETLQTACEVCSEDDLAEVGFVTQCIAALAADDSEVCGDLIDDVEEGCK